MSESKQPPFRFQVEDVDDSKVGQFSPLSEDEDVDHRFRDREAERRGDVEAPDKEGPDDVGDLLIEEMLLGAMCVDLNSPSAEAIKHFLTKSSSLLTASESIGDLLNETLYEAVDEEMELEEEQKEKQFQAFIVQQSQEQALQTQVTMARLLKRLSEANVARKEGVEYELHKGN